MELTVQPSPTPPQAWRTPRSRREDQRERKKEREKGILSLFYSLHKPSAFSEPAAADGSSITKSNQARLVQSVNREIVFLSAGGARDISWWRQPPGTS